MEIPSKVTLALLRDVTKLAKPAPTTAAERNLDRDAVSMAYEDLFLRAFSLNIALRARHNIRDYSCVEHAIQFRTVRLNVGRNAGETSLIRKYAVTNDAVFTHTVADARQCKRDGMLGIDYLAFNACFVDKSQQHKVRGLRPKNVWVDSSVISRSHHYLSEMYLYLASDDADQTFFLLGTEV